jgi:hypothetical protein
MNTTARPIAVEEMAPNNAANSANELMGTSMSRGLGLENSISRAILVGQSPGPLPIGVTRCAEISAAAPCDLQENEPQAWKTIRVWTAWMLQEQRAVQRFRS